MTFLRSLLPDPPTAKLVLLLKLLFSSTNAFLNGGIKGEAARPASCRVPWMLAVRLLLGVAFVNCHVAPSASLLAQQETSEDSVFAPPGRWPDILNAGTVDTQARIWFDESGKPVFIPNSNLDELMGLRQMADAKAPILPAANISAVSVTVDATEQIAEISGEFEVRLGEEDEFAEVSLRFETCRLSAHPVVTGDAKQWFFRVGRILPGYEWLVSGTPGSEHSIRLEGKAIVTRDASRSAMKLALPAAPTTVQIRLPQEATELRSRSEDIVEFVGNAQSNLWTIRTNGGDLPVTWKVGRDVSAVAAVDADSQTTFTIREPSQTWQAETRLDVRWYGVDATRKLQLRLPVGAALDASPNYDFDNFRITRTVASEETPSAAAAEVTTDAIAETLLIENLDITMAPTLDLTLRWKWMPPEAGLDALDLQAAIPTLRLGGVDSHSGIIDLKIPTLYSVVLDHADGAGLLHQGPASDTFGGNQYRFGFDRDNFDLQLVVRREESLPIVRPTYHVRVDQNKLLLTAWLECSFDPNQLTREIGIRSTGDWVVQENTARLIDTPDDLSSATGELLQVRRAANSDSTYFISAPDSDDSVASSGQRIEQTWRLVAERDWEPAENNELTFQVPQIIRGNLAGKPLIETGSGTLLLSATDNILLQPGQTTGLLTDAFSNGYRSYAPEVGIREPLVYRIQPNRTTPQWNGNAAFLPQQVTFRQTANLEVLNAEVRIQQLIDLQIANADIALPRIAVRSDAAQFRLPNLRVDGNVIGLRSLETVSSMELRQRYPHLIDSSRRDSAEPATLVDSVNPGLEYWQLYELVGVPALNVGARRLIIGTSCPWQSEDSGAADQPTSTNVDVPLALFVLPSEAVQLDQQWTVEDSEQVIVQLKTPQTASAIGKDDAGRILMPLQTPQNAVALKLTLRRQGADHQLLRIRQAWLQSVISKSGRRDRFLAQVDTRASEMRVQLPKFIDDLIVVVDGKVKSQNDYRYDTSTDTLVVQLTSDKSEHLLEVFYLLQEGLTWLTHLDVKSPRIYGTDFCEQYYWELVTPPVQHLGWPPSSLTPEWHWKWNGFWWARENVDLELERIAGASQQQRLASSANRYLMSGQTIDGDMKVWVLSRFALWFPVGAVAILITFLVVNFPLFRSPLAVVCYAAVLAGLAAILPDFSMLIGQTSVLSLSLVAIVLITQAAVDSRARRRSVFTNRPLSTIDSQQFTVVRAEGLPPNAGMHHGSSVATDGGR